ncbi:hypothetical protein [Streptomyces hoynatensis]|uniref:Uncharacterized protein n=1 Tax=Streptomyces hoynatensis TaxID=1141874 RepID=A0A3A9ZC73_9ACTN|nr:hypothetical protein D7294_05700 [Streptomyces hoynatensis]
MAEVVRRGRAPGARTPAEREGSEAVAQAPAATGPTAFAGRPSSALSCGERARAAPAGVLARRAPPPLLGEPAAALDLRHREPGPEPGPEPGRGLAAAGNAVVAVAHRLGLAAAHAGRPAVPRQGRLAAPGAPAAGFREERPRRVHRHPPQVPAPPGTGHLPAVPRLR